MTTPTPFAFRRLAIALAATVSIAGLSACGPQGGHPTAVAGAASEAPVVAGQPVPPADTSAPTAPPVTQPSAQAATSAPPPARVAQGQPVPLVQANTAPPVQVAAVPPAPVVVQSAQPAVTVAAPPPVAVASSRLGEVLSIEPIRTRPQGTGTGAVIGGVLGAVVGNQFGHGGGRAAMTGVGAVGGAVVGNNLERNHNEAITGYRVNVRLDNGRSRTFEEGRIGDLRVGDRVRVDGGRVVRV